MTLFLGFLLVTTLVLTLIHYFATSLEGPYLWWWSGLQQFPSLINGPHSPACSVRGVHSNNASSMSFHDQVLRPAILELVSSSLTVSVYPNTTYVIHQFCTGYAHSLSYQASYAQRQHYLHCAPARFLNAARRIVLDSATVASSWLGLLGINVYLYTGT